MAGYVRNDTSNNIATGNVINASDLDGEFDAIQAAFVNTTGHTHDGTAAEGAPITKVGPAQDIVVAAGATTPKTNNVMDLGSSGLKFKDVYAAGTAYIGTLDLTTALAVADGGTGATTLTGVVKGNGTSAFTAGNVSLTSEVTGTLPVSNGGTGATTLTGYVKGNGTGAFTASATVAGSDVSGNISGNAANVTGTVAVANGGTGNTTIAARSVFVANTLNTLTTVTPAAGQSIRINAGNTAWEAYTPSTGTGDAVLANNNAFTGANTFYNSTGQTFGTATSTQDGVIIAGRAGGSSTYRVTLTPTTLTASRTLTLPDATDTVAVLGTAQTFTALQTFSGSTSVAATKLTNAKEVATVSATAATGTINYDVTTQSVLYYTTNASANWTVNFRGSSGTSLNTLMATGESMTVAFLVTQGSTAYYNSAVQVDGSSVTPKWQGGAAPTAGNASSIDAYVYTIIKTGAATFTVFASQTRFA